MRTRSSKDLSSALLLDNPSSTTPRRRRRRRRVGIGQFLRRAAKVAMAEESRRWMVLVAAMWMQAFTGTNFDFAAYSSEMKKVMGISQVELNYLAVASDLGKAFGWSSGLALMYVPLHVVMLVAAFLGLVGYGLQWLILSGFLSLPYYLVFFLCLLAGCSICWFNTVCFVLCVRNFPTNRALAISLTVSFNGVSAALYTLAANSIDHSSGSLYLLLNALIPLLTSLAALFPILQQQPPELEPSPSQVKTDSLIFILLNFLAVVTGFYLLLLSPAPAGLISARLLFVGAILLLVLPICIPNIVHAREWFKRMPYSGFRFDGSGFVLVEDEDMEVHKGLMPQDDDGATASLLVKMGNDDDSIVSKDGLVMLGEEHPASVLVRRVEFWLYYVAYFCGGTLGLVYSNNLGQIAQSLGESANTTTLITLYSSFSFFGRLLSATPDYIRGKFSFARTGWLALALTPTPMAFFLLTISGSAVSLKIATALIGLSSGFIFAAAVSISSVLFGSSSLGVNHNILITNIPIGSFVYGLLAALVYDSNGSGSFFDLARLTQTVVCMGRECYLWTFMCWGCISLVGLVSSVLLFLRTKHAYDRFACHRLSLHV